jgi:hypothetical protein
MLEGEAVGESERKSKGRGDKTAGRQNQSQEEGIFGHASSVARMGGRDPITNTNDEFAFRSTAGSVMAVTLRAKAIA